MARPTFVVTTKDEDGTPLRVLWQGGAFQSATYLGERRFEPAFEYHRAFDRLFELRPDAGDVLAIGGGDTPTRSSL